MAETNLPVKEKVSGKNYDAVVIGSGPNGLAAAIHLAKNGMRTLLVEGNATIGGACRSAELTQPGFIHDICSSVHPLGVGSPFFRTLPLDAHGLTWVHPDAPYAHPFDDGKVILVHRSIEATAAQLESDGPRYVSLMESLNGDWNEVCDVLLHPWKLCRHPVILASFGMKAMMSVDLFARTMFEEKYAQSTFAGVAAHSSLPLTALASASIGIALNVAAHTVGWPSPKGGAQKLSDALAAYFCSIGGEIVTDCFVHSLDELPPAKLILCDVTPAQFIKIAGSRLSTSYRNQLGRYKYGPGSFKLDWALSGPIPWNSAECYQAATVHIGSTIDEIEESERTVNAGRHPVKPYVLLVQNSLFDPTRAPSGMHTAWAYCHVPNGSGFDMTERIEDQIERFAAGFRKRIIARRAASPSQLEAYNPNCVGGDINGGSLHFGQLFTRPSIQLIPYSTPLPGVYLCSSSTPPGSGVHGMCGYYAALAALHSHRSR